MASKLFPRLLYYGAVIGGALAVHQSFFADAFGEEVADVFRRNSEAYVLMALVPAYWDRYGLQLGSSPTDRLRHVRVGPRRVEQLAWIGAAGVVGVVLQIDSVTSAFDVPQSVITLSEGFLGAAVVALYLGWSRNLFFRSGGGSHRVTADPRPTYHLAVVALALLAHRQWVPSGLSDIATDNVETVAAALVLPAYFDWVYDRSTLRTLVWSVGVIVIPVLSQPGVIDGGAASLTSWLVRATEAFLAGLVIAWYYFVLRPAKPTGLRLP